MRKGFTIVEFMISVAIVSIIVALIIPGVMSCYRMGDAKFQKGQPV